MTSLDELRVAAQRAVREFNVHVRRCRWCELPPGLILCPTGERLNDEASTWAALKLRAEAAELQERPA
jgi:hypothetical protein